MATDTKKTKPKKATTKIDQDQQPGFALEKLYLKDVSVEVPNSPEIFTSREAPKIGIELNKASGFIRKQLSKSIHLKRLPSIRFTYDDTAERSERIENILKSDSEI